jgi:hypothetical protein
MRASRWEILGAWLHIWTPPRDVEVPPPPRRGLLALAALVAVGVVMWVVVAAPAIDDAKGRDAARAADRQAAFVRAERARLTIDQRPRSGRAPLAARLYAAGRELSARGALVAAVRASVDRDARARVASGDFDRPVRELRCDGRPGDAGSRVRVSCFAVTSRSPRVELGQPFVAAGSLRDGRYTWCHENARPGEGSTGTTVAVALSRACTGR